MIILCVFSLAREGLAQPAAEECAFRTGRDATFVFPKNVKIYLAGRPPATGDVLTAHTPNGICVGRLVWEAGRAQVIAVWGDDAMTEEVDGIRVGEAVQFQVFDVLEGVAYTDVSTSYARGSGRYEDHGIYVLSALQVRSASEQAAPRIIGEAASVVRSQEGADAWHTVRLEHTYHHPVVVMSPLSFNDSQPATVRVRNVTPNSFEFQIDEWDYLDGSHTEERIGYLVVEAGTHELEDGRLIQAGYTGAAPRRRTVRFPVHFAAAPVVLSQVASANNPGAVVTRHREVAAASFTLFLQGQEDRDVQSEETVAWVGISRGLGAVGDRKYEAGIVPDEVTHHWQPLSFSHAFPTVPVLLAAMQQADGANPAVLRYHTLTAAGAEVRVEEEQSDDMEIHHVPESVGYAAFMPGLLATDAASQIMEDGHALPDGDAASAAELAALPEAYALRENHPNPFRRQTLIRYDLPEPVHVSLEVFDVTGRRMRVLVDAVQQAGSYEVPFSAENLAGGVYFYSLRAGSFRQVGKMVLMR